MSLKIGDLILLTIKRMGINGEGIGFYRRQTVFVPGGLVGEVTEVEITDAKITYATGKIVKWKKTSPFRASPPCPYYASCGGCQLQHLTYQKQLEAKRQLLREAFTHYYHGDKSDLGILKIAPASAAFRYRNKSSLPLRHDGERVRAGIYALGTNRLVYIDDCPVESELITEIRTYVLNFLSEANVAIYNPRAQTGNLRFLVIRAFSRAEAQVTFVLMHEDTRLVKILAQLDLPAVFYSINPDPKSVAILGANVVKIKGKDQIAVRVGNLALKLSPLAFFQLNLQTTSLMYQEIVNLAHLKGVERVVDCYCGVGGIALYLAPHVKDVCGIDFNIDNINDAQAIKKANGITNAKFYCGDVLKVLNKLYRSGMRFDLIVLDPPRKGLEEALIAYLKKRPVLNMIYVSCNPSTLAKNLNSLADCYRILKIEAFDMFPNTASVEAVCLLEHK